MTDKEKLLYEFLIFSSDMFVTAKQIYWATSIKERSLRNRKDKDGLITSINKQIGKEGKVIVSNNTDGFKITNNEEEIEHSINNIKAHNKGLFEKIKEYQAALDRIRHISQTNLQL